MRHMLWIITKQATERTAYSHEVPNQPWSKLETDIFTLHKQDYLVTVDYFSDYLELDVLPDTTYAPVIGYLKQLLARHGIPYIIVSMRILL